MFVVVPLIPATSSLLVELYAICPLIVGAADDEVGTVSDVAAAKL
jgi:hypothetical protein